MIVRLKFKLFSSSPVSSSLITMVTLEIDDIWMLVMERVEHFNFEDHCARNRSNKLMLLASVAIRLCKTWRSRNCNNILAIKCPFQHHNTHQKNSTFSSSHIKLLLCTSILIPTLPLNDTISPTAFAKHGLQIPCKKLWSLCCVEMPTRVIL